jgi:hypothetical protein
MNNQQFDKLRLVYKIVMHISDTRQQILKDLISYADDPVRYQRRLRFLTQLADYEHQLMIKFMNLDDDEIHYNDEMLKLLKDEVTLITNPSS